MTDCIEFEVSLKYIAPRIWRRFQLRSDATFDDLHLAIQRAFGWSNDHLWGFFSHKGKRTIAEPGYDPSGSPRELDDDAHAAEELPISSVLTRRGSAKCRYVYDFGDRWEHEVVATKREDVAETFTRRLVAGARAGPPEDCGGLGGYEACCKFVTTGRHPNGDASEMRDWLGGWRPETFDLEVARRKFDRP